MRGHPSLLLGLPLLLTVVACGSQTVSSEDPVPSDGEAAFGESYRVAYPVGAYEHEFSGEADVVYTVEDVSSPEPGRVDFTLEVEVPQLGRVLGFGDLRVVCEAGGTEADARGEDRPGETEAGTHSFPLWCEVPEETGSLRIVVDDGNEEMVFAGPVG
ncbi:hypothetical protein A6A08_17415 [Nocardiopsis sp. TSRI0078]|uniref:hypothetical protein n=1 Tax=unclassified Nocardiopsis TaxID=2649073 RepID=UPI00093CD911|nr:hypothetical protein [Nocardiopsis sp. TSRI0078]OKI12340.1 hypothetical protein A6A08_17415 [Nocardiopsis sp. TSRI0078]